MQGMSGQHDDKFALDDANCLRFVLFGQAIVYGLVACQSYFLGWQHMDMWKDSDDEVPDRRSVEEPTRRRGLLAKLLNRGPTTSYPSRQPTERGMSSVRMGHTVLLEGEMRNGVAASILVYLLVSVLWNNVIDTLSLDLLLVGSSAWMGLRFGTMGPKTIGILALALNPHTWLWLGLLISGWQWTSLQATLICVCFVLFGLGMNMFVYPQHVFGVEEGCSWWKASWDRREYSSAVDEVKSSDTLCARVTGVLHAERAAVKMGQWLEASTVQELCAHIPERCSISSASFCTKSALVCVLAASVIVSGLVARIFSVSQTWVPTDVCETDTRGTCRFLTCAPYRNASCQSFRCLCGAGMCAVDGMCMPNPKLFFEPGHSTDVSIAASARKRALVFSGGGAKGAWQVGVMKALCEEKTTPTFGNWTMLLGTSIGALNAGFMAQFSAGQQCSLGVKAMEEYWVSIQTSADVWESPTQIHDDNLQHTECLRLSEADAALDAFFYKGGLCDPAPGAARYKFEVKQERINASGMELFVLATSLNSSGPTWWTHESPDIIDGALASGSISPLIYPKVIDNVWYVDGGFVANTPLRKAVDQGAEEIVVMLLNPLIEPSFRTGPFGVGASIVDFETQLMIYKYFVETELEVACANIKKRNGTIWGYAPSDEIGSLMDFGGTTIQDHIRDGYDVASSGEAINLCEWLDEQRRGTGFRRPPSEQVLLPERPEPSSRPRGCECPCEGSDPAREPSVAG